VLPGRWDKTVVQAGLSRVCTLYGRWSEQSLRSILCWGVVVLVRRWNLEVLVWCYEVTKGGVHTV